jgi:hypothetical protein
MALPPDLTPDASIADDENGGAAQFAAGKLFDVIFWCGGPAGAALEIPVAEKIPANAIIIPVAYSAIVMPWMPLALVTAM